MDKEELQFIVNFVGDRHPICAKSIEEARDIYKQIVNSPKPAAAAAAAQPSPLFSGPLQLYSTIQHLDAYIGKRMKEHLKKDDQTHSIGNVSDTISALCKPGLDEFQTKVCGGNRMQTSGSQFDCLIHSFLTMVSPNFRRLPPNYKDEFASAFRRTLFPKFPAIERSADRAEVRKRILASYEFLTDSELQILSLTYGINCIVFEQEKTEKVLRKKQVMPATITPIDNFASENSFYLISNRNSHYEAVKADGSYRVTRETMNLILAEFPQEFTGEAKPTCKYPGTDRDIQESDIVIHKGKPCMVLEKLYDGDPPRCTKLKVQRMETDKEEVVNTKDVSYMDTAHMNVVSGGRRSRKTRRASKARRVAAATRSGTRV